VKIIDPLFILILLNKLRYTQLVYHNEISNFNKYFLMQLVKTLFNIRRIGV